MKQKADAHQIEGNINHLFAYINLNVVAQGSSRFYDHNPGALTGNVHWNDGYWLFFTLSAASFLHSICMKVIRKNKKEVK